MADEVWSLYGEAGVAQMIEAKLLAFYGLHLHGRLLPKLLPRALPGGDARRFDEFVFMVGEGVAAAGLGYNVSRWGPGGG